MKTAGARFVIGPENAEADLPRRTKQLAETARAQAALVLIDLVNTWEMADGAALRRAAVRILPNLVRLCDSAGRAKIPIIFANDNFGRWRSNWPALLEAARQSHPQAARIVDELAPNPTHYIVLKPRHSAFYATPLMPLLESLQIGHLMLGGVSGDQCILATAGDALLRGLKVSVVRDATACATPARQRAILRHFHAAMDIPTPSSRGVRWS